MGWYGKNLVLWGQPTASTWFGQSAFHVLTGYLPPAERRRILAEAGISGIAAVPTFSPLEAYRPYIEMPEPTGSRALDEERKGDGTPNFNHRAYIVISRQYLQAAIDLVRRRPGIYVAAVARGVCISFHPSTDYWVFERNRSRIQWADRAYNLLVYGQLHTPPLESGCNIGTASQFPFVFPVLLFASVLGSTWLALRAGERPELRVTMAFVATTIAWVMLVGNLFEFGENNRFLFVTAPLMWIALAVLVQRAVHARSRRRPTAPSAGQGVEQNRFAAIG
jgi:hypothetical protein